jgi:hypothetical protein
LGNDQAAIRRAGIFGAGGIRLDDTGQGGATFRNGTSGGAVAGKNLGWW